MNEDLLINENLIMENMEIYESILINNEEIKELIRLQIINDIEIHRVNILLFGALLAAIVMIAFFKGVFNNA